MYLKIGKDLNKSGETELAIRTAREEDPIRVATFLTVIGDEALDVYNAFMWDSNKDIVKMDRVMDCFEQYREPRKNAIYERYLYASPSQVSVLSDDVTETAAKRSKSLDKKCDVLNAIAQRFTKTDPTNIAVNEQLATLVNGLMFKLKKPEESKLKEEGEKILRPQNCESLVVTKVDELIWNRLRPNMRSFDSRIQTAQGMLIKGVIEVTKMLNEMLNLKSKANDASVNDSIDYESKVNQLIDKGMSAIEMLSYADFEINMR